jgi:hypothetical protein
MEDARIVLDAQEAFLDNLRYEFWYNESENVLEVSYSFCSAIPNKAASIIQFQPHARTIRYHPPKHKGRNPRLDAMFNDPQRARSLAKHAEALFAKDLGSAIQTALRLLIHRTMYRCGVPLGMENTKLMADRLTEFFRTDTAKALGVKTGRTRRFRDADDYHRTLFQCMQEALENGEITHSKEFTQEAAAGRITKKLKTEVQLDARIIRQWNKDYDVNWRKFVNETWEWLTQENRRGNEGEQVHR